jgi:hypothetical protein
LVLDEQAESERGTLASLFLGVREALLEDPEASIGRTLCRSGSRK